MFAVHGAVFHSGTALNTTHLGSVCYNQTHGPEEDTGYIIEALVIAYNRHSGPMLNHLLCERRYDERSRFGCQETFSMWCEVIFRVVLI